MITITAISRGSVQLFRRSLQETTSSTAEGARAKKGNTKQNKVRAPAGSPQPLADHHTPRNQ